MGKSKASKRKPEASGIDQEGSSRAKRYELKLFSIQPPGSIGVGLSISFGITTVFIFEFTLIIASLRIHLRIRIYVQLSFHFYTGGDGDICKSRDYLILVSASHIHNSKGRAFSCTVALEPSNPLFSSTSLRKIFLSRKLTSCYVLRKNTPLNCFETINLRFKLKPTRQTPSRPNWDPARLTSD